MTDDSGHGANGSGPQATPSGDAPPSAGRRTVLRRALLTGAPILVTLHSGPVAAKQITGGIGGTCIKASGFVSVATFRSRNPGVTNASCSQRTWTYWQNLANGPDGTKPPFSQKVRDYHKNLVLSTDFNEKTVKEVLNATGEDAEVLKRILAMMLNLDSGQASQVDFSKAYLADVWNSYKGASGFKVSGVTWGWDKIADWLDYLMGKSIA